MPTDDLARLSQLISSNPALNPVAPGSTGFEADPLAVPGNGSTTATPGSLQPRAGQPRPNDIDLDLLRVQLGMRRPFVTVPRRTTPPPLMGGLSAALR